MAPIWPPKWAAMLVLLRLGWSVAAADELRLRPFDRLEPRQLLIPGGDEPFTPREALHGSFSSPQHCAKVPGGLWVEMDGTGDCIRHYAAGLDPGPHPKVMVYFSGDALLRNTRSIRFIGETYAHQTPAKITADMAEWSDQAGVPAIFLARPGLYGSSGNHNLRRLPREIALVGAALDMLKSRHGIAEFILVGHSGGGHLAASLLNSRRDIAAVVISSGLVSVKQLAKLWSKRRSVPDPFIFPPDAYYDPMDGVEQIRRDPTPQIYVLSDPQDTAVPFASQLRYVKRLRAAGFEPIHIYAHAPDPGHHLLVRHARRAAALIAREKAPRDIVRALDEIDLELFP